MKIYVGREEKNHNASGLILIDSEAIEDWLITEVGFSPNEHALNLIKPKILSELERFGVSSIWTFTGTMIFLNEEVLAKTAAQGDLPNTPAAALIRDELMSIPDRVRRHWRNVRAVREVGGSL